MKKMSLLVLVFILSLSFLHGEYIPKDEALSLLKEADSKKFPQSSTVYITNEITALDAQCLGSSITENYRKILNTAGRKNKWVSFWYNTDYEAIEVDSIELIKPSGKIIPFDPKKILTEKDNSFPGRMNIYSNLFKVATGELPDIQIGDIIYTKHKRIIKKAPIHNHYSYYFRIENFNSFINKFLQISLPQNIKLNIHELNNNGFPLQHATGLKEGVSVYKWNVSNPPLILNEPNIEDYNLLGHHIKMTTQNSWEEISRWYFALIKPHMSPSK
ncbi:MAG: DUF3857 domain-containing protein, partial [bacterium]|nr:DUF3857 domain-containing protein [bacterium]